LKTLNSEILNYKKTKYFKLYHYYYFFLNITVTVTVLYSLFYSDCFGSNKCSLDDHKRLLLKTLTPKLLNSTIHTIIFLEPGIV